MTGLALAGLSRRAALVVALALVGTGCGGGPSSAEFAADANKICEKHRSAIDKETSKLLAGGELPGIEQLGKLAMGTIVPETEAQLKELKGVEPSDELKDAFTTYLDEGNKAVGKLKQDPSTLTDPANFAAVNKAADDAKLSKACRLGPS